MSAKSKGQTNQKNTAEQADELKRRARRRLMGAIALFLTALIVVPAIIETEPAQTQSPIELVVPGRPNVSTDELPAATPSGQSGKGLAQSSSDSQGTEPDSLSQAAAESEAVAESNQTPRATKKAEPVPKPPVSKVQPDPKVVAKPEPKSPVAADPIERFAQADVYWVQVVAVKDKSRAEGLRDKLSADGFEGRIESVSTDVGLVYRVRVGPLAGQTRAQSTKERLKKSGYDGRIVQ